MLFVGRCSLVVGRCSLFVVRSVFKLQALNDKHNNRKQQPDIHKNKFLLIKKSIIFD